MPGRFREKPTGVINDGAYWYGNSYFSSSGYSGGWDNYESMTDVVGQPFTDNVLDHYKSDRGNSMRMNGWNGQNSYGRRAAINRWSHLISYGTHDPLGEPSYGALATQMASRTNPSKASFSLPNFIFELHEVPRLVRLAGRTAIGKAASANLGVQFGILPVISDVNKMLNFTASVDRRMLEFEKLASSKGLYRKIPKDSDSPLENTLSEQSLGSKYLWSTGWNVIGTVYQVAQRTSWGTIRWRPTVSFQKLNANKDYRKLAQRLINGTAPSHFTINAWNALPWSWLVDWFSNVGDYLTANQNTVAYFSNINIMSKKEVYTEARSLSYPSWLTLSSTRGITRTYQDRSQPSPGIDVSVPFLSGRQLSILGSLAALKGRL